MKKPERYELKKWIYGRIVCGLKLHYYQTGTDTAETDWEMTDTNGKKKRVKADSVKGLVDLRPDWVAVLRLQDRYIREVEEWDNFAKKEAKDLAEFERLKNKFS